LGDGAKRKAKEWTEGEGEREEKGRGEDRPLTPPSPPLAGFAPPAIFLASRKAL